MVEFFITFRVEFNIVCVVAGLFVDVVIFRVVWVSVFRVWVVFLVVIFGDKSSLDFLLDFS